MKNIKSTDNFIVLVTFKEMRVLNKEGGGLRMNLKKEEAEEGGGGIRLVFMKGKNGDWKKR